ncbi:MAG: RNA 2',3'-cyclic phosphodiesterase [Tepidisphaeraceae bacterium]|jgi:2'-5' RNA ligase
MRLFVAIELPEVVRQHLQRMQDALRPVIPARWTKSEQLHVTLKFLGETLDADVPRVIEGLRTIQIEQPIQLSVSGVVCFPPHGLIRIVAAAMADAEGRCVDLAKQIDTACHDVGFALEHRPWTPHVTIGRVKERTERDTRDRAAAAIAPMAAGPSWDVEEFALIQSHLDQRGPTYIRAAHFPA